MSDPSVPGPADHVLLERVRARALPVLAEAFAAALSRADDALFDRAEQAGAAQMRFLDGMRELRRRSEQIAARFQDHLQQAWQALAAGRPPSAEAVLSGPSEGTLSLVGEDELEARLAVRNLAAVLQREGKSTLARLQPRLARVAGLPALETDANPLGPDHVGVAVHAALATAELAIEVRLVLFKLCERAFAATVATLYPALDAMLREAGVLPDLGRPGSRLPPRPETEIGAAMVHDASADEIGSAPAWTRTLVQRWVQTHVSAAAEGGTDTVVDPAQTQHLVLQALHELLEHSRRTGAGQVPEGGVGGPAAGTAGAAELARPLSQREMLSVLSRLQATPSPTLSAALGEDGEPLSQRLKSEVLAGVSQLGVDPARARLDPLDEDAIDLVGMLFDVMLEERELIGRARALIGRLVVPFVKVALLDRKMFVHKTHPARRLLNALAEACEGNNGQTPAEQALMGKVEDVVERLVAEFNENLAIFLTLEEEFREFLARHRRKIEIAERRAAEAQRGQEKLEQARARAAAELDARLEGVSVPPALQDFLSQAWTHHLTLLLLREGDQGPGVVEALALADGVLDELAEARRHRSGRDWLRRWHPALRKVLASVGLHGEAADATLALLSDALQAVAEQRPAPVASPLPTTAAGVAACRVEAPSLSLPAVGAQDVDAADVARFRHMPIGTWLDFVDREGKVQPGKLSWISPISSRRLFVNRRGVRFCVASPEELAMMVRLGRLRPHDGQEAFDSALQGVIERLETVAAAPAPTLH